MAEIAPITPVQESETLKKDVGEAVIVADASVDDPSKPVSGEADKPAEKLEDKQAEKPSGKPKEKPMYPNLDKPAKRKSEKKEAPKEDTALTTQKALAMVGSIPVNVLECSLSDKEKAYAIKLAKWSLIEATRNQDRAEFIRGGLHDIFELEWSCFFGREPGHSASKQEHITFTLGEDTVIATKIGSDLEARVVDSTMDEEMKEHAIKVCKLALMDKRKTTDFHKARYIKKDFDKRYGTHWNCSLGTDSHTCCNYDKKKNYIWLQIGLTSITIFKTPKIGGTSVQEKGNSSE